MRKIHLLYAVIAVLLVTLAVVAYQTFAPSAAGPATDTKTYANDAFGITFSYPSRYSLTEHAMQNMPAGDTEIVLTDHMDANVPANSDGPRSITVSLFNGALQNKTLDEWVRSNGSIDNYAIAPNKTLSETAVGSYRAVAYGWDGLYRGITIAVGRSKDVILFSVSYNSPDDQIYKDFPGLIASVQFGTEM